ncbi:DUF2927 domain-containing protein [Amorphus orientalis]|uniref:DUF2927 domain-containing protein n=1 Tax=Amorphus orientalis TaxID=649198 RepID=A0AAE3VNN0_9HYPH|nr:DUF2927 domain-containing protein [Amorphus orientalis]MDQ0315228.1 hypothetical protein [Amorphus orientalis]
MRASRHAASVSRIAAGFALVALLTSALPAKASDALDPGSLRDAFYKVVFGLEYGSHHGDSQRVKKFTGPVRFHVINRARQDQTAAVHAFIAELPGKIDGLKAMLVRDPATANFVIYLVDRSDFAHVVSTELNTDAVAMGARCLVGVQTRSGRIISSTAVIVADDPYLFKRCMVEEILQGLGPMNDNASLSLSVFNDTSRHTTFTSFDQALLRLLYHPSIRPGMTGRQVNQVLPRALADLGYYQ